MVESTFFTELSGVLVGTAREFLPLLLKVLPLLVVGALAGAALQTFLSEKWSERLFGGDGLRPLLGSIAAGALFPGCACATMPMAAGLRGMASPRLGTVAAFIFVSPLLSPITVALTWAVLGWQLTAARVVASLVGSVLLGMIVNRFEKRFIPWVAKKPSALAVVDEQGSSCDSGPSCGCEVGGGCEQPGESVPKRLWASFWKILRTVTPYFLVGMAIAAVVFVFLPEDAIPTYLGGSTSVWAYALAAVVGIPMYVCEGEEVPIAYALAAHGLGPGPTLTFLLGSVGTCIPTFLMPPKVIGPRATVFSIAFWLVFVVGAGVLFQATTLLAGPLLSNS